MAGGIIRYDDMQGSLTAAAAASSLLIEGYRDTGYRMPFFRHDQDDYLYLNFQFSHRKKLGTALTSVHLHYVPMVDPSTSPQNVYLSYKYYWQTTGSAFPTNASWVSGNITIPIVTGDAFISKYYSLLTNISAPASEGYSSIFLLTLARLGTSPNDTYDTGKVGGTAQANLGLLYVDCHYQTDRRGSVQEGSD